MKLRDLKPGDLFVFHGEEDASPNKLLGIGPTHAHYEEPGAGVMDPNLDREVIIV